MFFALCPLLIWMMLGLTPPLSPQGQPTSESHEDWIYEMTNAIGDAFYMDRRSFRREGDIVHFKEKTVYGKMLRADLSSLFARPVYSGVGEAQVDCKQHTVQRGYFKPAPVEPGSDMENALKLLCDSPIHKE